MFWDSVSDSQTEKTIANAESAEVKQDDLSNSGKLISGALRISGHMVQSQERLCEQKAPINDSFSTSYEVYDSGYNADGLRFASGNYHFVLHQYDVRYGSIDEMEADRVLIGLIVEPLDQRLQTYRRIGMFRHCLGCTSKPSEYHEFDDWDPSKSERHTITII
jgi:hypothetical protein